MHRACGAAPLQPVVMQTPALFGILPGSFITLHSHLPSSPIDTTFFPHSGLKGKEVGICSFFQLQRRTLVEALWFFCFFFRFFFLFVHCNLFIFIFFSKHNSVRQESREVSFKPSHLLFVEGASNVPCPQSEGCKYSSKTQ